LSTSESARSRVPEILGSLADRYLPNRDLHEGETALAKIVARTEDPFVVLISTILSQRTRDEMTEKASLQLFAKYPTVRALARAPLKSIVALIRPVGFYRTKAAQIRKVSHVLLDRFGGRVPDTYEELLELPQVGPKTANCVLVYGYGEPRIPVDTHVHRVSNRLGLVTEKTPDGTEAALMRLVPKELWLHVNELFIRFGKEICRPIGPRCNDCSFRSFCRYYRTVVSKRAVRSKHHENAPGGTPSSSRGG
jgi:endonuclease III